MRLWLVEAELVNSWLSWYKKLPSWFLGEGSVVWGCFIWVCVHRSWWMSPAGCHPPGFLAPGQGLEIALVLLGLRMPSGRQDSANVCYILVAL